MVFHHISIIFNQYTVFHHISTTHLSEFTPKRQDSTCTASAESLAVAERLFLKIA
jgi:hypothetical protein